MTTQQPEALRLAGMIECYNAGVMSQRIVEDYMTAAAELRRQHARITELDSQLAQRFDAADMATAAAQGFRDGVTSAPHGQAPAPEDSVQKDAARYRLLRRGQHWSVTDGIGNDLRSEALDAAVDAARKQGKNHDNS